MPLYTSSYLPWQRNEMLKQLVYLEMALLGIGAIFGYAITSLAQGDSFTLVTLGVFVYLNYKTVMIVKNDQHVLGVNIPHVWYRAAGCTIAIMGSSMLLLGLPEGVEQWLRSTIFVVLVSGVSAYVWLEGRN